MDIQKLRQEFEKLPDIKGILHGSDFGFNESLNQYYHPDHTNHRLNYAFIMGAWMAWKAQTVPEGFVLVKMDDLELLRDSTLKIKYASLNNDSDRIFSDIEDIQLSIERLIEAQEQSHE